MPRASHTGDPPEAGVVHTRWLWNTASEVLAACRKPLDGGSLRSGGGADSSGLEPPALVMSALRGLGCGTSEGECTGQAHAKAVRGKSAGQPPRTLARPVRSATRCNARAKQRALLGAPRLPGRGPGARRATDGRTRAHVRACEQCGCSRRPAVCSRLYFALGYPTHPSANDARARARRASVG